MTDAEKIANLELENHELRKHLKNCMEANEFLVKENKKLKMNLQKSRKTK